MRCSMFSSILMSLDNAEHRSVVAMYLSSLSQSEVLSRSTFSAAMLVIFAYYLSVPLCSYILYVCMFLVPLLCTCDLHTIANNSSLSHADRQISRSIVHCSCHLQSSSTFTAGAPSPAALLSSKVRPRFANPAMVLYIFVSPPSDTSAKQTWPTRSKPWT
jgi:hypothetical protein